MDRKMDIYTHHVKESIKIMIIGTFAQFRQKKDLCLST